MGRSVYAAVTHDGRWALTYNRRAAIRALEDAGGGEVLAMDRGLYREGGSLYGWDAPTFRVYARRVATVRGRKSQVAA